MAKFWRRIRDYVGVFVGAAITAFALAFFLVPQRIAAGGVSGIAIILFHLFGWPVGLLMLIMNVPLLLVSMKLLGAGFGAKTVFGALLLSVLIDAFSQFAQPITTDPLLAAIYGGVLAGIGLGITFRFGGSTGGTDLAAQIIARYFPTSVGVALLFVDGLVILTAGFIFNMELALYALLAVFITSKAIDVVQQGQSFARAALIISSCPDEISRAVVHDLNRGATRICGQGVFTGAERQLILVILSRMEITHLKRLVKSIDEQAFITIADVHEVLGEGFKVL